MKPKTVYIYLLHLNHSLGGEKHRANHYVGASTDVNRRLREHRDCRADCAFTAAAVTRWIEFDIARVWESPNGYNGERTVKAMKNYSRYCPVCNPRGAMNLQGFTEVKL